jgi:glycosyltransferase involved in cell wall biosynthesis
MPTEIASHPRISVLIKSYNEEARIAACIESALAALAKVPGEVILADSGSNDRTLAIASRYPIAIVQLADPAQRRCGVGPQLAYQFATNDLIYVLDGDMELDSQFLDTAVKALQQDQTLAGVAGLVKELSESNLQFRRRKSSNFEGTPGDWTWLNMGGLYRRDALRSVGYLSDRNLFAHEEQDLGLRLTAAGWKLRRLPVPSITHYGHTEPSLALLRKRWESGYLFGAGQILRSSLGKPWFGSVLEVQKHLVLTIGLWLLLSTGLAALPWSASILMLWLAAMMLIATQRIIRFGSLTDGLQCLLIWQVNAVALIIGFFLPRSDPLAAIQAVLVKDNRPNQVKNTRVRSQFFLI